MVKITRINTNRSGKSAVTASSLVKLMDGMTRDDSKNSVGAFRDFLVMAQNHYGRGMRWTSAVTQHHQILNNC